MRKGYFEVESVSNAEGLLCHKAQQAFGSHQKKTAIVERTMAADKNPTSKGDFANLAVSALEGGET